MIAVLFLLLGLPASMLLLYTIGIQYQREGWWTWVRGVCKVVAGFALLLDFLLNWTLFSVYLWELPLSAPKVAKTEWTLSDRLERLVLESGWRAAIGRPLARLLNWIAPPGHIHIKAMQLPGALT